jgi:hypothetical protein
LEKDRWPGRPVTDREESSRAIFDVKNPKKVGVCFGRRELRLRTDSGSATVRGFGLPSPRTLGGIPARSVPVATSSEGVARPGRSQRCRRTLKGNKPRKDRTSSNASNGAKKPRLDCGVGHGDVVRLQARIILRGVRMDVAGKSETTETR